VPTRLRAYVEALEPDYLLHDLTVRVTSSGSIWVPREIVGKKCIYVGTALAGHLLGLRELDDGRWLVSFTNLQLGHLDPELGFDPAAELLA
tara:strand:+ start:1224 stop:1496 length:273 start_codon:yes stop_codon:yes gene_type:complete